MLVKRGCPGSCASQMFDVWFGRNTHEFPWRFGAKLNLLITNKFITVYLPGHITISIDFHKFPVFDMFVSACLLFIYWCVETYWNTKLNAAEVTKSHPFARFQGGIIHASYSKVPAGPGKIPSGRLYSLKCTSVPLALQVLWTHNTWILSRWFTDSHAILRSTLGTHTNDQY